MLFRSLLNATATFTNRGPGPISGLQFAVRTNPYGVTFPFGLGARFISSIDRKRVRPVGGAISYVYGLGRPMAAGEIVTAYIALRCDRTCYHRTKAGIIDIVAAAGADVVAGPGDVQGQHTLRVVRR